MDRASGQLLAVRQIQRMPRGPASAPSSCECHPTPTASSVRTRRPVERMTMKSGAPMPERDLVRTGITGLDVILSEGIPRGNVILVEGAVGTGKTTLGVEFVYRGASEFDEPGLIVLFEVSPEKI